jgi:hypothetical protein
MSQPEHGEAETTTRAGSPQKSDPGSAPRVTVILPAHDCVSLVPAEIAGSKRRVLSKRHQRLADEGLPGLRAIHADPMWWPGRMRFDRLRRGQEGLRCCLEGLRHDPEPPRIPSAVAARLRWAS